MRIKSLVRISVIMLVQALSISLLIHFGSIAHAEYLYPGTNIDISVSDPIPVTVGTSSTLYAITLTARGQNGYLPNAFDGTRSNNGGTGITTGSGGTVNSLHQVGLPSASIYSTTNTPNFAPLVDTHFLIDPPDAVKVSTAETMNVLSILPGDSGYGGFAPGWFGNSLTGIFTLTGTPTSSNWDFARLVVPLGTLVNFDFKIGAILSGGSGQPEEFIHSFTVDIPEPGTVAMLCSGCVCLLALFLRQRSH
jgi:hypothetical protein